ncbi:MAG: hypothetical protein GEU28_13220 [Dehalococcoidia bacterium]|nr:hypothetical protein [Dehalococcoidia bacterium]
MLLFTAIDHEHIVSGDITITWRLWKYAHVRQGRVYATSFGGALEIDDVRTVRVADITDADAREVGQPDAAALIEYARSHTGAAVTPDTLLYRVQFHYLPEAPAKPELSLDEVRTRIDRLDRASKLGRWTLLTLRLIEENPAVGSRYLAPQGGQERLDFKTNVRKLKGLGLTISLGTGYELSELGQAYLDSLDDET